MQPLHYTSINNSFWSQSDTTTEETILKFERIFFKILNQNLHRELVSAAESDCGTEAAVTSQCLGLAKLYKSSATAEDGRPYESS